MKLPDKFANAKEISPGKNATVYRATNTLLGRDVFLKLYPIVEDDKLSALREPHLLQALNHDHLVKIYGADTVENNVQTHICLEMELVSGGSLNDLIEDAESSGRWPSVHGVLRLIADAAAGLGHLHDNGFVHRDVKPANIMARDSNLHRAGVVTDLGLASRLSASGRSLASKHARIYRPPEVWSGMGYTVRSDVYQLGIVLFQLLGGNVAFCLGKLDDNALATAISRELLLMWESLPAHISRAVRLVIRQATATEEAARYESMTHFCLALNNTHNRQLDWRYTARSDGGFVLERSDGTKELMLDVAKKSKNTFTVQRFKKASGKFRRARVSESFQHENLSRCQPFLALLRDSW